MKRASGRNLLFLPVLFLIALVVYLRTLCPTVYQGDSGEILTTMATLGGSAGVSVSGDCQKR